MFLHKYCIIWKFAKHLNDTPSFPVSDAYTKQETNPVWYLFIYNNNKKYTYVHNETGRPTFSATWY